MPVDDAIGGDRIGTSRPRGYDYHRGHPKAGTFICELVEIALKVRTHYWQSMGQKGLSQLFVGNVTLIRIE
jgi:hypothetical protein